MPPDPSDPTKPIETHLRGVSTARAVSNFQLFPENGGYVLIFGERKFAFTPDSFLPIPEIENISVNYLSHSMMKDLSRVLSAAISEFEKVFGCIPVPGLDEASKEPEQRGGTNA